MPQARQYLAVYLMLRSEHLLISHIWKQHTVHGFQTSFKSLLSTHTSCLPLALLLQAQRYR